MGGWKMSRGSNYGLSDAELAALVEGQIADERISEP
jgi:hypothetical protein